MATYALEGSSSSLATYYNKAECCYSRQSYGWDGSIDTITIHCYVGQVTAKSGCDYFANPGGRVVSANYVVGYDGSIGISVPENLRSACSSNSLNDARAVTIEVASETREPYKVNNAAYNALLNLVTDICLRNNIKQLVWSTVKADRVNHKNGCNMTVHRDYSTNGKTCPGTYLYDLHGAIATEVNRRLKTGIFSGTSGTSGTISEITSVIRSKLVLTEVASTYLKVLFELVANDDTDFSDYTYSYNVYKIIKKDVDEELIIKDKKFTVTGNNTSFNINKLIPNTTYAIEILARNLNSSTDSPIIMTPKRQVKTLQEYPKEVTNAELLVNKSTTKVARLNQSMSIQFSPTSDWGYWGTSSGCQKGYRISLIVNGKCILYKDDLVQSYDKSSVVSVALKSLISGTAVEIEPNTTIQIGVQPWVCLVNTNDLIIDETSICSSNSVFVRQVLPNIDKMYLKHNNKKYQRIMLYLAKKRGVFID